MRGQTKGGYAEALYSMPLSGALLSNSSSRALMSLASSATGGEPCRLFPSFWEQDRVGQAFKIIAKGFLSTTGTPTFTFAVSLDTTQGSFGTVLAATGAVTMPSGASGALFDLDADCTLQGVGSSGYLTVGGKLTVGAAGNAATTAASVYALGNVSDVAVNTTVDNYVEAWGTFGTASASNFAQLYQLTVIPLN